MIRLGIQYNNLMQFVFLLAIAQALYDTALLPYCGLPQHANDTYNNEGNNLCHGVQVGVGVGAGICTSTCTNIVSFVVCYVILTRRSMHVRWEIGLLIILIPAVFLGTMCGISYVHAQESDDGACACVFASVCSYMGVLFVN